MKRPLRAADWLLRVPLGLAWFGVLAVLAIPVVLYMTGLYYVVRWGRGLGTGGRSDTGSTRPEAA